MELDFWDNVSVNLFSNVVWVLAAYATMQVFKRIVAGRHLNPGQSSQAKSDDAVAPEGRRDLIRRVSRSVFQLAGLLIFWLLICSFFVGSPELWRHLLGWILIAGVWAFWFWCTRDPRASRWLRNRDAPVARIVWFTITIAFWAFVMGGLVCVVYALS